MQTQPQRPARHTRRTRHSFALHRPDQPQPDTHALCRVLIHIRTLLCWGCVLALAGLLSQQTTAHAEPPATSRPSKRRAPPKRPTSLPAKRQALPKRPTTAPAKRRGLPRSVGPVYGPTYRRRRRRIRRRRRRRSKKPRITWQQREAKRLAGFIKSLPKRKTRELIERLRSRHWVEQRALIEELERRGAAVHKQLRDALEHHTHIRVKLLVSIALARLDDESALPFLMGLAQTLHDQEAPLLAGAILEYGPKAVASLLQAIKQSKHPRMLLKLLSLLGAKEAQPLFQQMLLSQQKWRRTLARQALERMPVQKTLASLRWALRQKPNATQRAELIRALSYLDLPGTIGVLLPYRKDPNGGIEFLARLTVHEQALALHKKMGSKRLLKPPGPRAKHALWLAWWAKHKAGIKTWVQRHKQRPLQAMPRQDRRFVRLLYRTVHPMFGYGRMPLFVYDKRWKKAPSPIRGKVWRMPLEPKAFAALLKTIERNHFFSLYPNTGSVRDLTVYLGKRKLRVQVGNARDLHFEKIEEAFLRLARRLRLGLKFFDFYLRPDEAILSRGGEIGQWAYRTPDRLPLSPWSKLASWRPAADLESVFSLLKDLVRLMPGRTRLVSLDIRGPQCLFSSLLYGSRIQSRYTLNALLRSRRIQKPRLHGIRVTYLTRDKIELAGFLFLRRLLPQSPHQKRKTPKRVSTLYVLQKALHAANAKVLKLTFKTGPVHRIFTRLKLPNTHALMRLLAHLALYSRGDRILALRVNQSGAPDRHSHRLILQLQWEMKPPAPKPHKTPYYLDIPKPRHHDIFTPVYR